MCATDKKKVFFQEVTEGPGAREAVVPMLGPPMVWESLARDMFMQTSHGDNMSIHQYNKTYSSSEFHNHSLHHLSRNHWALCGIDSLERSALCAPGNLQTYGN